MPSIKHTDTNDMSQAIDIQSPGVPIKAWTRGVDLADNAIEQLRSSMATSP